MIAQKEYNAILIVLGIGLILDNLTTMLAVLKYGIAAERNDFTVWLFTHLSYFGITLHAIIVLCLYIITTEIFRKDKTIFYVYSTAIIIGYVYVLINNFKVIL